ncbi:MAG: DUF3293 domain-containing protein [Burkholderiaceae bacterium]
MKAHPAKHPDAALVVAYEATEYRVFGPNPCLLKVGDRGGLCDTWLDRARATSASILTAWNPFSLALSPAHNARRQRLLRARVRASKLSFAPAEGRDPSGQWPPEPSVCVFDLSEPMLMVWLMEFEQYAALRVVLGGECHLAWHPETSP